MSVNLGSKIGRIPNLDDRSCLPGLFVIAFLMSISAPVRGENFYSIETAVASGAGDTQTIYGGTSINDEGSVAFVANNSIGNALYFAARGGEPINVAPGFVAAQRGFSMAVQLNNSDVIVAQDKFTIVPPLTYVRLWYPQEPNLYDQIREGQPGYDPESVQAYPALSNNDKVVYTGVNASSQMELFTNADPNKSVIHTSKNFLYPVIADDGTVAYQATFPYKRILKYDYRLTTLTLIASQAYGGFTELGAMPGISEDGKVIVFVGNRGKGMGIFAAANLGTDKQYHVFPILGEKDDASPKRNPDLGYDISSGNGIDFASFEVNTRVGIIRVPFSYQSAVGDMYLVAFIATPAMESPIKHFTTQKGIFVVPVGVHSIPNSPGFELHSQYPATVVQIGNSSPSGAISSFGFNDPIARLVRDDNGNPRPDLRNDHQIAFLSGTTTILRARHKDHLSVIPHNQGNKKWATLPYAYHLTDGVNIRARGCALNSTCMSLDYLGIKELPTDSGPVAIHPGTLNDYLLKHKGYTKDSDVVWDNVVAAFSYRPIQFVGYRKSTLDGWESARNAREFLKTSIRNGFPVIVVVHPKWKPNDGVFKFGHFILVTGIVDGGYDFSVLDPGASRIKKLSELGDFETRGYFLTGLPYVKPRSRPNSAPYLASDDSPSSLTTDYTNLAINCNDSVSVMAISPSGLRIGLDTSETTGTIVEEVPDSAMFLDGLETNNGDDAPPTPPESYRSYIKAPHPEEGEWRIILTGLEDKPFDLQIQGAAWDGSLQPPMTVSDTLLPGQTRVITYTYRSDPVEPEDANDGWQVY